MARKFLTPVELPAGSTAPTPSANDNSTKLATTAYVDAAVAAGGGGSPPAPVSITASTTLTRASHGNRTILVNSTGAVTLTIGTDASGGWQTGDYIDVIRYNTGTATMAFSSTTVRRPSYYAATLRERYSRARLTRIGANEWHMDGDLTFV